MHWAWRFLIIAITLVLQGAVYHGVQHITTHEYDFTTSIDRIIPRIAEFVWVYHSLVPVILFTHVVFIRKKEVFISSIISFMIALVMLNSCFLLFPSAYPRGELEPATISEQLLSWTYSIDAPHNTFPSTHITFAWLVFFNMLRSGFAHDKRIMAGCGIWATLILISTLVLKQHNIIDAVSGVGLAMLAVWLAQKIYQKVAGVIDETVQMPQVEQYENC